MSTSNSQPWGNVSIGIVVLLVIFFIWAFAGGRPMFRSGAGRDIKTTVQDAGQDLKSSGRDLGDSIRRTVQ